MEPSLSGARYSERGVALAAALGGTLLMLALGSALVLITVTEVSIGARYARGAALLAATELVLESALLELQNVGDWNLVLNGSAVSSLTDGPAAGLRTVGDVTLDLSELTSEWRCGRASCTDAEQSAVTASRPWGSNNPRWQPFAWTSLDRLLDGWDGSTPAYVVVWVADDPAENDGNPLLDGAVMENSGRDTIVVLAEGRGAGGLRRVLEATVRRTRDPDTDVPNGQELLTWREVR